MEKKLNNNDTITFLSLGHKQANNRIQLKTSPPTYSPTVLLSTSTHKITLMNFGSEGDRFQTKKITLDTGAVKIGRKTKSLEDTVGNAIFDSNALSRIHAETIWKEPNYFIVDKSSRKGTFLTADNVTIRLPADKLIQKAGNVLQFGYSLYWYRLRTVHV